MKKSDNLQEIKNTLEHIRAAKYPDISPEVISTIVDIQFQNQEKDRRVNGRAETNRVIKQFIDSKM